MKSFSLTLYLTIIMFVSSCQKDVLQMPTNEPRLVISGYVYPDSCYVLVSATEKNTPDTILDQIIMLKGDQLSAVLYEDGVFFDSLHSRSVHRPSEWPFDTVRYFYVSMKKTKPGSKYRLEVSCTGYPSVSAETYAPFPVPIIGADTVMYQHENYYDGLYWTDTVCYLDLSFADPAGRRDYYIVSEDEYSYSSDADSGYFTFYLQEDLLFENQSDQYLYSIRGNFNFKYFSDDYIRGKSASVRYFYGTLNSFWNNEVIPDDVTVRLYTISEEYYKYNQSKLRYMDAEGDPNSEPVIIYSNVQGGYGIFAGISYSEYTYTFNHKQ